MLTFDENKLDDLQELSSYKDKTKPQHQHKQLQHQQYREILMKSPSSRSIQMAVGEKQPSIEQLHPDDSLPILDNHVDLPITNSSSGQTQSSSQLKESSQTRCANEKNLIWLLLSLIFNDGLGCMRLY
jgi:hypothetical protein